MDDSPARKKRKKSLSSGVPLLSDAVKSDASIPTDGGEGLFYTGKELWLIQLPKEVSDVRSLEPRLPCVGEEREPGFEASNI